MLDIDTLLKILTPIAIAAAWIWTQIRIYDREEEAKRIASEDRERAYSVVLEERLANAQEELQNVLNELRHVEHPEKILRDIVTNDPGIMFVKKRLGYHHYIYLQTSKGYGALYIGGPSSIIEGHTEEFLGWDFKEVDEEIYTTQKGRAVAEEVHSPFTGVKGTFVGRKFPLIFGTGHYIVGVGDHEHHQET